MPPAQDPALRISSCSAERTAAGSNPAAATGRDRYSPRRVSSSRNSRARGSRGSTRVDHLLRAPGTRAAPPAARPVERGRSARVTDPVVSATSPPQYPCFAAGMPPYGRRRQSRRSEEHESDAPTPPGSPRPARFRAPGSPCDHGRSVTTVRAAPARRAERLAAAVRSPRSARAGAAASGRDGERLRSATAGSAAGSGSATTQQPSRARCTRAEKLVGATKRPVASTTRPPTPRRPTGRAGSRAAARAC